MKSLHEFKQFELKELETIKGGDNGLTALLGSALANIQVHAGGGQTRNPLAAAASLSGSEIIFNAVEPTGNPGAHEAAHLVQGRPGTRP